MTGALLDKYALQHKNSVHVILYDTFIAIAK